ncbi:hypothetical protein FRC17_009605 [Serendipita sp. 399]|nr:hypothetical protein FRC17_009605 [Serendipita sp. 399]
MTLLGRNDVQAEVNERLRQHRESCNDEACNYLEDIKDETRYSILSHRWSDHEVVFQHIQTPPEKLAKGWGLLSADAKLAGLREHLPSEMGPSLDKFARFLDVSKDKGCSYAWADTICINKESSAELDESIRSMFAWYRDSHICIVYLSETSFQSYLGSDPWFRRGWTLQELLAPRRLAFYAKNWKQLTRYDCMKRSSERAGQGEESSEGRLWSSVANITGIQVEDLHNFKPGLYDIRKRLSWASNRKTTRIEDMAYSLIGIFDVNLPIAYGEKERAFYRLQVEILQNSDDMSLFDWQGEASMYSSMLALSPACFSASIGLRTEDSLRAPDDSICTQTSIGIRMPPPVYHLDRQGAQRSWKLPDGAIAFSILGASSKPSHHVILLLGAGSRRGQYKRLALIEMQVGRDPSKQVSDAVFVK